MKTVIQSAVISSLLTLAIILALALLPRSIAYLHIKSTPCGAMLRLNGYSMTIGQLNCRVIASDNG